MKKLLSLIAIVPLIASAASVKISDLPLKTSVSTNTFIEVADMNAATKSGKYLLTNLVTQSENLWTSNATALVATTYLQPDEGLGYGLPIMQISTNDTYWGLPSLSFPYDGTDGIIYSHFTLNTIHPLQDPGTNTLPDSGVFYGDNLIFSGGFLCRSGGRWDTYTKDGSWESFTTPTEFAAGVARYISNFSDPSDTSHFNVFTNQVPVGNSYHCFIAQRGDGLAIGTNEAPFGIWIDGIRPAGLYALSDGFDYGAGNSMRWAINGENPGATLDVWNRHEWYPTQVWRDSSSNVVASVSTNGLFASTQGYGSTATDTAVTIDSTGWTNSFTGKNAMVYLTGSGVTFTVYDNAGTSVYTNATTVGSASIALQPSGKIIITAGTGISGRAVPW